MIPTDYFVFKTQRRATRVFFLNVRVSQEPQRREARERVSELRSQLASRVETK